MSSEKQSITEADHLPKKGDELELTIESLAYGGQGVARHDGFVIFIKRGAVPGSKVRAVLTRKRKGFGEGRILEVLEQAPTTLDPPCTHFGICGGCSTQNMDYTAQLEQKQAQVRDLYKRMGHLEDVDLRPIIGCDQIYNYRNKMEFTFSNRGWVESKDDLDNAPDRVVGLHIPGRFDKILPIETCHIQHPLGNRILQLVAGYFAESDLKPWDVKKHTGYLRHLVIRVAKAVTEQPEIMVNFVTAYEAPDKLKPLADQLAVEIPEIVSVVNNINTRLGATAYGEYEIVMHGKPMIQEALGGLIFDISSNSFFQTNTAQAELLYGEIKKACNLSGDEVVFDLYSGTGSIGLTLAAGANQVYGFESVSSAIEDAARNALLNEVYNARFFQANLEAKYFTGQGKKFWKQVETPDIIVIDPPRAGMHPKLVTEVAEMAAKRIVYVSCNPATQVRDVGLLAEAGYRIVYLQPVDMFPHTPHIENICLLER
ncbi:23S rRNA (uracil(1939)-C(5))-methyltransferase RlmD [Candidatus Neomarinimicrobiota bacterium]